MGDKKIRQIVKEQINRLLESKRRYRLTDFDELNEYMWLKPNMTKIGVDIFVDDGMSYVRNGHELLLFVRNSYNRNSNSFIPISISSKPRVLDDEMSFNISYNDIFDVYDFIQENISILQKLANQKITQEEFVRSIRHATYRITESFFRIDEMATLRASESGLPMDIWLDEGGTYQGHASRIKFKASNEQRTTKEFSSMLLTNPPSIENYPENSPLRKKDIEKLERFVVNNLDALISLSKGEIDYLTEFKPNIITE